MTEYQSYSHRSPGVSLALGSAFLFGAIPPLSKLLLKDIDPFMLAGLLYLGAGSGLGLYWVARGGAGGANEASMRRVDMPWLAAAIGMGGILAPHPANVWSHTNDGVERGAAA